MADETLDQVPSLGRPAPQLLQDTLKRMIRSVTDRLADEFVCDQDRRPVSGDKEEHPKPDKTTSIPQASQ